MDHLYFDNMPLRAALPLQSFGLGTLENLSRGTQEKYQLHRLPTALSFLGPKCLQTSEKWFRKCLLSHPLILTNVGSEVGHVGSEVGYKLDRLRVGLLLLFIHV